MKHLVSKREKQMNAVGKKGEQFWRERIGAPAYQVRDAARYAGVSVKAISYWQNPEKGRVVSRRTPRSSLSYLQLIEVSVVAAFREAKISFSEIRTTREYMKSVFGSDFPFAQYQFKSDGERIFLEYNQIDPKAESGRLIRTGKYRGQFAWAVVLGKLKSFEYDSDAQLAIRWRILGESSHVAIDPRVAFGAPQVGGVPTWLLRDRWSSLKDVGALADDYGINRDLVADGLKFEGIDPALPEVCLN